MNNTTERFTRRVVESYLGIAIIDTVDAELRSVAPYGPVFTPDEDGMREYLNGHRDALQNMLAIIAPTMDTFVWEVGELVVEWLRENEPALIDPERIDEFEGEPLASMDETLVAQIVDDIIQAFAGI